MIQTLENSIFSLFELVKSDIRIYANISGILEKIGYDQNFGVLSKVFTDIFDFETVFAFTGLVTRAQEVERGEPGTGRGKPANNKHSSI